MTSITADAALEAVAAGEARLTDEQGVELFENAPIELLGAAAHAVRMRLHPEPILTYVADRNVNYTNVCVVDCDFCAFYRKPRDPEGYVLSREELHQKLQELVDAGGTQVLLQGGHHPKLKLDWYVEMLGDMKANFPLHLHAFSPPEISHITRVFKMSAREVLKELQAAGLDSLPGGGGEILADRVRQIISPKKVMSDEYIDIMRAAHELGMKTSATMMFGHVETFAERIETLRRYRDLQDETGGYSAYICWGCQPDNTPMTKFIDAPIGAVEYLRTVTISRLYLDNIPNIQASWVTLGAAIGQVSMQHGCNDWGGTMMEENVVSQAGTAHEVSVADMRRMSEDLGYELHKRDHYYNLLD